MKQKFLILIDVQNDFITGALRNEEAIRKLPNIIEKVRKTDTAKIAIFATKDTHYFDYLKTYEGKNLPVPHCTINSEGWNFPEELIKVLSIKNFSEEDEVYKSTFGSVATLKEYILSECKEREAIEEIEVVGFCTDICVISNVLILRAWFPNAVIKVDASCCAGVTIEKHKAALEVMKSCQITVVGEEND